MALKYVVFFPESGVRGDNTLQFQSWYISYKRHDSKTWHEEALLKSEIGAGREWLNIQKHGMLAIAIGGAYDAVIHKLLSLQASRKYFPLLVALARGPAAKGAPAQIKSDKEGGLVAVFYLSNVEVITLVPWNLGYFINLRLGGDMVEVLIGEERGGAKPVTLNEISEFDAEGRKRW